MPEGPSDAPNFDISGLLGGAMNMMHGVKGMAENSRKTVAGFFEAASALNRSAKAMEQLVNRMTKLMDDMEAPIRALTPEIERATERARRVSEALEGPVESLVQGLEKAVGNFDRMAISGLPETMEVMGRQLTNFLELFGELPKRLAPFFPMAGRRFGGVPTPTPIPTEPSRTVSPPLTTTVEAPSRGTPTSSLPSTPQTAPRRTGTANQTPAKRTAAAKKVTPAKARGSKSTKNR